MNRKGMKTLELVSLILLSLLILMLLTGSRCRIPSLY